MTQNTDTPRTDALEAKHMRTLANADRIGETRALARELERELAQWETLANESISDAGEWKTRARNAERDRAALRAALAKVEQLIDPADGWHHPMARMPVEDAQAIRALLAKAQP